jgi:hypothetical protein
MHVRRRPPGTPSFVLRQHFCPGCGYCLVGDVTLAGSPAVRAPKLVV